MALFDDTELFATGNRGKVIFDLPDASVMLWDGFFDKAESDFYYDKLLHGTPWQEYKMEIYDKEVAAPRMIAWYEDKENPGADPNGADWTPELVSIRKKIEDGLRIGFNSVLLNLYRNGSDGVAWHSDREHVIGKNPTIASVSFGQARAFRLRHKTRKDIPVQQIPLYHGTLLLMSGATNTFWQHHIPKTSKPLSPRINLTFRQAKREK